MRLLRAPYFYPDHDINPVNRNHLLQPEGGHKDHKEVTETIIGCAYRVYNIMGFGFLESVYQDV